MILLAVAVACPAICQVTGIEYYIDTDPGYRNATLIPVTAGNDITKNFILPLASVTNGFHIVGVRAKDAQGHWSVTQLHSFYVTNASATNIAASEYYIDTDPGYGNATAISATVGADNTLKFIVPLSSYSKGFHALGIRSKDNAGRWSQTKMYVFVINTEKTPINITSLQYYFTGEGSTDSVYTYAVPEPAPNVDLDFIADLSQLQGNSEYDMHIIAVSSEGSRSQEVIKHIKVCNGNPAKAKFTYAVQGTQVSFTNNSVAGNNFEWYYGDGKTDTVKNSFHTYDSVGIYPVKLIASNACNSDTTFDTLSITGLKSIYTNIGGNTGTVTVDIRGAGFDSSIKVYLHKDGQTDILSDTVPSIQNSGLLTTTFDLTNKALGLWDVVGVFSDGKKLDTLHNAFTIEQGTDPKLWVNMAGDYVLRVGFNQIYTITYGNDGNTDALFVPVVISGLPLGTDIEVLRTEFKVDSFPGSDTTDLSIYKPIRTIQDTSANMSLRIFFLSIIPANSVSSISVVFHLPLDAELHATPQIEVALGKSISLKKQNLQQRVDNSDLDEIYAEAAECYDEVNDVNFGLLVDLVSDIDPTGIVGCLKNGPSILNAIIGDYEDVSFKEGKEKYILDGFDAFLPMVPGALSCTRLALNAAGIYSGAIFIPTAAEGIAVLDAELVAAQVAVDRRLKTPEELEAIGKISYSCVPFFYNTAVYIFNALTGNATDPNQKFGAGDSSSRHYINSNPLAYTIGFENKKDANLNAQTITVSDTLNKSYYNYSTFGFTSVSVGDSIYALSSPATSFIHDFDFTAQYGVKARVTATFDTTTGVAEWKFLSIDPVTNQATTNALAGFLPPDVNSPEGQGYVSFIVRQNPNLKTGDTAHNKATIVFDYNPAITTNSWQNVFDYIFPASKVKALPSEENDTTFNVQWNGTDNLSGIRSYDVYYSMNGGAYQLWLSGVSVTDSNFTGQPDSIYSFYSIATDNAGNIEPAKTIAEATTHVTGSVLAAASSPLTGTLNQNHTVRLSWKTYTETNNKGFYIERNAGNGWQTIGFLAGALNSTSTKQYVFIDSTITVGKVYYYRYKQTDNDGHSVYSNQVVIEIIAGNLLALTTAPNPFKNETTITYSLPVSGHVLLRLFNYTGREVSRIIDTEQGAGTYSKEFNGTHILSSGVYILRLETNAGVITSKIIIVK